MNTYVKAVALKVFRVDNEKGAEVVEWVLWVGGIAVLAGVIYATVNSSMQGKVSAVMNLVAPIGS